MKFEYVCGGFGLLRRHFLTLCLCVSAVISLSCGSKPTDPRTVIPADSLVYLETADLGQVLDAITSNNKFQRLAKTQPDTSALNGIRLSIAVTGFQTDEHEAEGGAVLDFKPRFVAVAETNAWNYQALGFAERKLGEFVNDIYGGEVELITSDKHNGKYFTWTAKGGRKAFALVRGSLILFGNDETAIDNCVNVMNGGADSMAKNDTVSEFPTDALASGYVSEEGVAQIANIAGVSLAVGAGEAAEVKSFVARIVPEIVRNSVTEVTWTARRIENGGIEDSYLFATDLEVARALSESIAPAAEADLELSRFVPVDTVSTTRYNLTDPRIAWRGVLLTAAIKTDPASADLLRAFSPSLFEPYGIEEPEVFLGAVGGSLATVRFDAEGDEVAVAARIKDLAKLKQSVAKELDLSKPPVKFEGADLWRSKDGELAAAIVENTIVIGEATSVEKCLSARAAGRTFVELSDNTTIEKSKAAIITFARDPTADAQVVSAVSELKSDADQRIEHYTVESRFNLKGVERRTVSWFGLIGSMIERLDP